MWDFVKKNIFISASTAVIILWGLFLLLCLVPGGSVSDIFTSLGALFTGLAFAGTISSIFSQQKALQKQDKRLQEQEKRNMRHDYMSMIDRIIAAKNGLTVTTETGENLRGHQVVKASLEYVSIVLAAYDEYFRKRSEENTQNAIRQFIIFYENYIKAYLPVSSQVHFLVMEIIKNSSLSSEEKENIFCYLIFNLTAEDKQLLNLVFLRSEVAKDLEYFHKHFNEPQVRRQLLLKYEHIKPSTLNAFIFSLMCMTPATKLIFSSNGDTIINQFTPKD